MHEFYYDYVNQIYGKKVKLRDMNTDSFIVSLKADDIYKNITEDAETTISDKNN